MCRASAEGGRRCTGSRTGTSAAQPATLDRNARRKAARDTARTRYAEAFEAFRSAEQAVNGGPIGSVVPILLSAISRHAETGRHADTVTEARALVRGVLTGRGMSPGDADAAITRLEATYGTWRATPER